MKRVLLLTLSLLIVCSFVSIRLEASSPSRLRPVNTGTPLLPQTASDPPFDFPAPQSLPPENKLTLWATNYYVYSARAQTRGVPLLDMHGRSLGHFVTPVDWCKGGIEGTFNVIGLDGRPVVFNFAGRGATQ